MLNLEVPEVDGADLGSAISDLSDDLVVYAIGFAVIGIFWYGHHKLFARLGRGERRSPDPGQHGPARADRAYAVHVSGAGK